MKKAINIWSFPPEMTIEACMRLAAKAGFVGIELALTETGGLSLESTPAEVLVYRKAADTAGVMIAGLATGLYWKYSLTSSNQAMREKAKNLVKKHLEIAALLGSATILVVPGAVGSDYIPGLEVVDYDIAYELALDGLKELATYAEAAKVTIGLENVWNKFLLSPLETRDFIDKIGSDYVGVYLDVGNVTDLGYAEQWVKILGQRIKQLHFKDYRRDVGGIAGFVDLLAGDVNWPRVMAELTKTGYSGFVVSEIDPPVKYNLPFAEQLIHNTSQSLDGILGR